MAAASGARRDVSWEDGDETMKEVTKTEPAWLDSGPAARDFSDIYLRCHEELLEELDRRSASHPVLGPAWKLVPTELRARSRAESQERSRRAFEGDWGGFAEHLREQGAAFAAAGVQLCDWYDLVGFLSRQLTPKMVDAYAKEPPRLSGALVAMQVFFDRSMAVLAESYLSAKQRAFDRVNEELKQWEAVFQHASWGVCVTNADGRTIEVANNAFTRMYGLEPTKVRGLDLSTLIAEGEIDRVNAETNQAAERTNRASFETVHVRADGSRFPVVLDAARLPGPPDSKIWAINVRDLSERKLAETLRARSIELEAENRRIQEGSRLKSEFLANMSHELRTPLNSIIGFSELLHLGEVGPMSPKQTEFVGDILASGRHLLRLISDVLDLSKVEAGKMEFYPERIELKPLLDEVTGVLHPVARGKSIDIVTTLEPKLGELHLDPARIKQILYNFLSNALKFSPKESRVEVRICAEGTSAFRIEVVDNGPGIAPEDHPRLFVEFEQLHRGRAKTHGGTGLGLALTRRLVEAQGGTVGLESAPGKGSVFWALLPRKTSGGGALPQPRRIAGATPDAPRVLVVEDDSQDQERIVGMLVGAGFAVDTAATFAQAMQSCERNDYAAITLDLLLPDATGLDVLRAVRHCPRSREVPIIVVSVVTEQVTNGFLVHDVLTKPLSPDALLCSLERAGVSAPGIGPVLVVDDDSSSARLMVETLEQLGFRAVIAGDGHQALESAQKERPSAVVLDLLMPHLDGFGFLDRFRAEPIWSHIPVLVWTVKDVSPAERAELLRRAEAVMLKDGRGTRTLVHTLKDHLPRGARKTTVAHGEI